MKNLFIIACGMFAFNAFAGGIDGEEFLPKWAGEYEITKCIDCPDNVIEGATVSTRSSTVDCRIEY